MILNSITYNTIQDLQDMFLYNIINFFKLPIRKRLGISPFMLINCPVQTTDTSITNFNNIQLANINDYIKKITFLNNSDKFIINSRSIYNTKIKRVYQALNTTQNSIIFNSQPENNLLLDEKNKFRDELSISYDYCYQWEYLSPKYTNVCIPQTLNYYKQELTPVANKTNKFNKLNMSIDYNTNYITTKQELVNDIDAIVLNILIKKPFLFELYEVKLLDLLNTTIDDLLKAQINYLDPMNYRYMLKSIIEFCFQSNPENVVSNITKTQNVYISNTDKEVELKDSKLKIKISVTQNNTNKDTNMLCNISDGYNILFLSNYKYYTNNIPANLIYNDKVIQEINGNLIN